jgi:NitT/TauT family transport system ATP-binding protein
VSDPVLRLDGVSLRYPTGTTAVEDLSLELDAGEFVAVVGPSGCGKSTLLRLAARLLAPTAGQVIRGSEHVGYVFQDPTLLPWRSVARNVELVGELRGLPRQERRTRAAEALTRVGLAAFADARPQALSGGMRMRASLARTLAVQPDLMLLDEPFSAVDELTRGRLGDDLQRLFTADRFAALFVTHSVGEAVYLASRVLVMSHRPGRIVAEIEVALPYPRTPEQRYQNDFTAIAARVSGELAGVDAIAVGETP